MFFCIIVLCSSCLGAASPAPPQELNGSDLYTYATLYKSQNNGVGYETYLHLAAEKGFAHAQYELGLRAFMASSSRDFSSQNHIPNQVKLKEGYTKARDLFYYAAAQGHVDAQIAIGSLYWSGKGVQKDEEEAVRWYLRAADQGSHEAQYLLGRIYAYDISNAFPQDYKKARHYFALAHDNGNPYAQKCLDSLKKTKKEECTLQ